MACGTPVIVSKAGALPEAAGEAGLYVDSDDSTALAGLMCRVLGERDLWAQLAAASLKQAENFCWTRSAGQLLALLRDAAANA